MRRTALTTPLIWHFYLFAVICGLFLPFYFLPALVCGALPFYFAKNILTFSKFLAYLALFSCSGLLAFFFFKNTPHYPLPEWTKEKNTQICGQVAYTNFLPDKRLRLILTEIHSNENAQNILPGYCALTLENSDLQYPLPGQTVCCKTEPKHSGGFSNNFSNSDIPIFPATNWRIWVDNNKNPLTISGTPHRLDQVRHEIFIKFLHALNPSAENDDQALENLTQGQAIIVALLFGNRCFLNQKTINLFSNASLAHSLALSGQHLGIAAILALVFTVGIAYFIPVIYLWQPRIILVSLISIIPALLYLWLGDAPPSLLRAFGMLFFFAFFMAFRKPRTLLDLLFLTLAIFLLCQPHIIYNTGLQLSVLCILTIALSSPAIFKAQHKFFYDVSFIPSFFKHAIQILLISFIIQLALLPISLIRFQQTGIWFPFNIIWLPVLAFFILPMSVLGLICALPGNAILSKIATCLLPMAELPCEWLLSSLAYLDAKGAFDLPIFISSHWSVFIAFMLAMAGCAIFWSLPQGKRVSPLAYKLLAASLCFLAVAPILRIYHARQNELSIEAMDVGQAQALVINFPNNGQIILDGGGSKSSRFDPGKNILTPILSDNKTPALSSIISSHPDLDHIGGLFYLIDKFSPVSVFHNGREANSGLAEKWHKEITKKNAIALAKGDRLQLGNPANKLVLEVLHPPRDDANWKGNSASLVLRLTQNGEGLALFTGDSEKDTLKYITQSGQDLKAKLLVAPHHGSDRSLYAPFYNAVSPEIVMASCGFENRWNYPGKRLTKFLQIKDIPLYDTGNYGRIKAEFKKKDLQIKTAHRQ